MKTTELNKIVSEMSHPDIYYEILQKSIKKLAQHECYSYEICSKFCNFRIIADLLVACNLITPVIEAFKRDVEKFLWRLMIILKCFSTRFWGLKLEIIYWNTQARSLWFTVSNSKECTCGQAFWKDCHYIIDASSL